MSSKTLGQWRRMHGRSGSLRAMIVVFAVLVTPGTPVAQDNGDFIIPDSALQPHALLVAEVVNVDVKVSFIAPTGIGEINGLQLGTPYSELADNHRLIVSTTETMGGTKTGKALPGTKTAASLNVRAAPGQPITILVDDVVATDGYSLADFRCNYNAGDEQPCDGTGYSEIAVADGTLMVGATLFADGKAVTAHFDGSFAVTISYQ